MRQIKWQRVEREDPKKTGRHHLQCNGCYDDSYPGTSLGNDDDDDDDREEDRYPFFTSYIQIHKKIASLPLLARDPVALWVRRCPCSTLLTANCGGWTPPWIAFAGLCCLSLAF